MIHPKRFFHKNLFWAAVLVAQSVLFYVFSHIPHAVQIHSAFFEMQKLLHQSFFDLFPFSVGDYFYIAMVLMLLYIVLLKKRKAIAVVLISANVLYLFYQLFWGMLYFQPSVSAHLPAGEITNDEIKKLSAIFLKKCRQSRERVSEDTNGVFKIDNLQDVKNEILKQQFHIPRYENRKPTDISSIKPSAFSPVLSYTGIMGYYNPFTAEAQYNAAIPSTALPFTIAHEAAHQLGYAREEEASFIAYLTGRDSANNDLRYSTDYNALMALLNSVANDDPAFVKETLQNFSEKMKRDREASKIFSEMHDGWLTAFFGIINDLFLKSNQQEGAVTYSYFVRLLVNYERNHLLK